MSPFLSLFCRLRIPLFACVVFIVACQPVQQSQVYSEEQSLQLAKLQTWEAKGKISLRYQSETNNAQFQWQQQGENFQIHLFGPFGQGSTWLKKQGSLVSLESADTGKQFAESAEALMEQNLGWHVPVTNMHYWLRGLPAPSPKPDFITRTPQGFIDTLQQQGWQVIYRSFQVQNGWNLPYKLVAARDDIKLIVVIKEWNLAEAKPIKTP